MSYIEQVGIETSPFVTAGPAPADDVVGREEVLATIADRAAHGRFVLLTAPRRYGKTTLVRRLARDAAVHRNLVVVIVDLLGVATMDEIALRMAQAWSRLPAGPVAKALARVLPFVEGIGVAGGMVSLSLRPRPASTPDTLQAVLDVPRAVAERTASRVLVVLDEFQAVAGIERADAVIRSQIQHQTEQVSYLFAGSEQSVLELLFTDRARPLYGQAERIELGGFDPDALAEYVDSRFEETERSIAGPAMSAYLAATGGHPQRSMLLADTMWATVQAGETVEVPEVATAVDDALARCGEEFTALLAMLTDNQIRTARLLAWGEPLTGAAAGRLALSQGSARSAAATLRARGVFALREGLPVHVDPFLAEWLRRLGPRP